MDDTCELFIYLNLLFTFLQVNVFSWKSWWWVNVWITMFLYHTHSYMLIFWVDDWRKHVNHIVHLLCTSSKLMFWVEIVDDWRKHVNHIAILSHNIKYDNWSPVAQQTISHIIHNTTVLTIYSCIFQWILLTKHITNWKYCGLRSQDPKNVLRRQYFWFSLSQLINNQLQ